MRMAKEATERARATSKFTLGAYSHYARVLLDAGETERAGGVIEAAAAFDDGSSDSSMEMALISARFHMRQPGPEGFELGGRPLWSASGAGVPGYRVES